MQARDSLLLNRLGRHQEYVNYADSNKISWCGLNRLVYAEAHPFFSMFGSYQLSNSRASRCIDFIFKVTLVLSAHLIIQIAAVSDVQIANYYEVARKHLNDTKSAAPATDT